MGTVRTYQTEQSEAKLTVAHNVTKYSTPVLQLARQLCGARDDKEMMQIFKDARTDWQSSAMHRQLRALANVVVLKLHMPSKKGGPVPEFKIHRFSSKDPYHMTFKNSFGRVLSVAEFFDEHYGITCMHDVPLVELNKRGEMCPLELLATV